MGAKWTFYVVYAALTFSVIILYILKVLSLILQRLPRRKVYSPYRLHGRYKSTVPVPLSIPFRYPLTVLLSIKIRHYKKWFESIFNRNLKVVTNEKQLLQLLLFLIIIQHVYLETSQCRCLPAHPLCLGTCSLYQLVIWTFYFCSISCCILCSNSSILSFPTSVIM